MVLTPSEYVLYSLYTDTFSAHTDDYVLNSTVTVHEKLTPERVAEAFAKGESLSGYTAHESAAGRIETTVGVVDFDEGNLTQGRTLRAFLDKQGIPALVVGSRRGCHVWTFHRGDGHHGTTIGGPVPANTVRRALENALKLTDLGGEKAEVFPKASAKLGGWGAVRMPLFKHPKSGAIYPAYSPDDRELSDVLELVNTAAHLTADWSKVWMLAGGDSYEVPYPAVVREYREVKRFDETVYPSITDQLRDLGVEATPGHSVKCPFHGDNKASLSIARDDERAFCKSPSCVLYNDGRGMGSITLYRYLTTGVIHAAQ